MPANPESPRPYKPTPIAEAKAFNWQDLLKPTQDALYELLVWLRAACDDSNQAHEHEHVSTSILIHGARGTGKTTVLLSAAQAIIGKPDEFFPKNSDDPRASELADFISDNQHRITWMEPLDLEPLPETANLLAAILGRVRTVLDEGTQKGASLPKQGSWRSSSLLEESAEDPWGQLDRLIRDATFMWEDIPETTEARLRTEQQIKASDIYAKFQQSFGKTMEKVATTLAVARSGSTDHAQGILVLPIDNVDRSIGHLYNIVKLTRMVTSPRLWFVMAAGHEEFQLFMERSFQKELIASGRVGMASHGAVSGGPGMGSKIADETLAIARRQASTTLRRALPPSYRIHIDPVNPEDAWNFKGKDGQPPLKDLLEGLELPQSSNPKAPRQGLESFADLFDVNRRLSDSLKEDLKLKDDSPAFTSAACMALTLPARTLRDLWHSLDRENTLAQQSKGREPAERSVRIATQMLCHAIDESELPAWASRQFLHRMIRYDFEGNIVLDLTGKPVRRTKRTTLSDVLEVSHSIFREGDDERPEPGEGGELSKDAVLISELHLRHIHDVVLELTDLEDPNNRTYLPGNVAGWFMLLYDVLMLFDEPRVLNVDVTPYEISPDLVVTLHELWVRDEKIQPLVKMGFLWSLPTWAMFVDFNIFTLQWQAFLPEIRRHLEQLGEDERYNKHAVAPLFRYVLAAWVDNICSVAGNERGRWELRKFKKMNASLADDGALRDYRDYEDEVRARIGELARESLIGSKGYDRLRVARIWLEQVLPQLVFPEFAPSHELAPLLMQIGPRRAEKSVNLLDDWMRHLSRLTRIRQILVRAVAMRSSSYEALRAAASRLEPIHAEEKIADWLEKVTRAWFEAVDQESERAGRGAEVFRRMTPLELDERQAPRRPAGQEDQKAVH